MTTRRDFLAGLGLLAAGAALPRRADAQMSDQQALVDKSRVTFGTLVTGEQFREMPDFVKRAKAVLIFPDLLKAGFIIGGEGGSGILCVRDPQRGWSDPAFYTMLSGSIGLQIGGQISQVVFTLMSQRAVDAILENQMKFGGNVSLAMGPIGGSVGGSTTTNMEADVYSFATAQGLFVGMSFDGAGVLKKDDYNTAYYGQGATPYGIVIEQRFHNPGAQQLRTDLGRF
ncbi:MAG: lipid-binding SYLF domain-containing protein [Dongiaceae bacterium]